MEETHEVEICEENLPPKSPQGDDKSPQGDANVVGQPKKPKQEPAAKNWCFTWHFDGEPPKPTWPNVQFVSYQPEICPKTGKTHLQGYVQFKEKLRFSALKKLQKEVHWEKRRGSHKQALAYTQKEDTRVPNAVPVQEGEPVGGAGGFVDLQRDLDQGMSVSDAAETYFAQYLRYSKSIESYIQMRMLPRDPSVPVFTTVLYGPPGTGKTRYATHHAGPDAYWLARPNSQTGALWWDGYNGQETVVIDEFSGWVPRELMCTILDRYPCTIQKKGASTQLRATKFFITSNKHPSEWWPNSYAKDGLGPIQRRISAPNGRVIHMPGPNVWVPDGAPYVRAVSSADTVRIQSVEKVSETHESSVPDVTSQTTGDESAETIPTTHDGEITQTDVTVRPVPNYDRGFHRLMEGINAAWLGGPHGL